MADVDHLAEQRRMHARGACACYRELTYIRDHGCALADEVDRLRHVLDAAREVVNAPTEAETVHAIDLLDARIEAMADQPVDHVLEDLTVLDGWDAAECACGWTGPPCPDAVTAANFWAQHLLEAVTADA